MSHNSQSEHSSPFSHPPSLSQQSRLSRRCGYCLLPQEQNTTENWTEVAWIVSSTNKYSAPLSDEVGGAVQFFKQRTEREVRKSYRQEGQWIHLILWEIRAETKRKTSLTQIEIHRFVLWPQGKILYRYQLMANKTYLARIKSHLFASPHVKFLRVYLIASATRLVIHICAI